MKESQRDFYQLAAKRFAASTFLYKVDALVHVEDKDDIWFWQQVLNNYRPGKYKFLPGTKNENHQHTNGCTQCLKYKGFLSQRFFICIDSDLRYLLDENISAHQGILQTYTYSWENHCCFDERLQKEFEKQTNLAEKFDFKVFLNELSKVLYIPFLLMMYCEKNKLKEFGREKFKQIISLQYRAGEEKNNGQKLLERLDKKLREECEPLLVGRKITLEEQFQKCSVKGITEVNVYLFIRGHALYNLINSIGTKLCEGTGIDFEGNILKSTLSFDKYEAIKKIREDVSIIKTLPSNFKERLD